MHVDALCGYADALLLYPNFPVRHLVSISRITPSVSNYYSISFIVKLSHNNDIEKQNHCRLTRTKQWRIY